MDVFAGHPPQVLPRLAQGCLDPGRVAVRKGSAQIVTADPVLRQPGAEPPGNSPAEIRRAIGIGSAQQLEHPFDQATEHTLAVKFQLPSHAR